MDQDEGVRVAEAKKRLLDGTRITQEDIVVLVRASDANPSLAGLTDRGRGNTLLHLCARHGLHDEALVLLRNGADPNAGNGNGEKPFSLAPHDTTLREALLNAAKRNLPPDTI
jgi:hypothetical protein